MREYLMLTASLVQANIKFALICNYSAYYNLAIVYKTQNDTDSAILWYKKAI